MKLKELCSFYTGTGFPKEYQGLNAGDYPFYKVSDVSDTISRNSILIDEAHNYINESILNVIKGKLLPKNTVIFAKIGEALKLNRRAITTRVSVIDNNLMGIKPNEKLIDLYYFYYFMKRIDLVHYSESTTLPSVRKSSIENIEIKLLPLWEQRKKSSLILRLESIIAKKKDLMNSLDELIKSRFEEMFGDFSYLQKEMKKDLLSDYLVFLTSGPRGWAKYYSNDGSLFITIKNLVNHQIDINDVQYIDPPDSAESKRTRLLARDLLISITADLGRTAVVTKEIEEAGGYINQHIALMRLDLDLVNPVFLSYCLESDYCKRQIIKSNQNGVKAGLNFKALKNLSIVIPKIELQNKFEEFVIQINKLKFAIMVYN